jgi:hypothetical protein
MTAPPLIAARRHPIQEGALDDTDVSKGTAVPEPEALSGRHEALVERWWADHFPGSPVAAVTAAWNHAFAAKEELKRCLANSAAASFKEDN